VDYTEREDWSSRLTKQLGASMGQGLAGQLSDKAWILR
jgi:hypothetical protein